MEQMIAKTLPNVDEYCRHRLQLEQEIFSGKRNLVRDLRLE
jgi:hypothetical protein